MHMYVMSCFVFALARESKSTSCVVLSSHTLDTFKRGFPIIPTVDSNYIPEQNVNEILDDREVYQLKMIERVDKNRRKYEQQWK